MSAPPPPTDREALARSLDQTAVDDLRRALARTLFARGRQQGSVDPETWEAAGDEMQVWLLGHADALIAGPLAPLRTELADLRSKLAAVEGERDEAWDDAEASERAATRHFVSAENAAVERDAIAGMAGEAMARLVKLMAERQKLDRRIHCQRLALRETWDIVEMRMGTAARDRYWQFARDSTLRAKAADSRAREAGARAERAEAALKPFAQAANTFRFAIAPDGHDEGFVVTAFVECRREYEITLSTADFSLARQALETNQAQSSENQSAACTENEGNLE